LRPDRDVGPWHLADILNALTNAVLMGKERMEELLARAMAAAAKRSKELSS
jgi:hypothetical protein